MNPSQSWLEASHRHKQNKLCCPEDELPKLHPELAFSATANWTGSRKGSQTPFSQSSCFFILSHPLLLTAAAASLVFRALPGLILPSPLLPLWPLPRSSSANHQPPCPKVKNNSNLNPAYAFFLCIYLHLTRNYLNINNFTCQGWKKIMYIMHYAVYAGFHLVWILFFNNIYGVLLKNP